jgi:hypothetical protein
MWVEAGNFVVEFVKAAAWPIAITTIALRFRTGLIGALPALFRGKVELEAFGAKAKFEAAEQQRSAAENPATKKLPALPAAQEPSPRPAVNIIEAGLRDALNQIEAGKSELVLLRQLAETRLVAEHEFTYNRIFGSQIFALKRWNEMGRVTVDDARKLFDSVEKQYPALYSTYSFDNWLGFLVGRALVLQKGNALEISEFGRDFLIYLTERRLSENKPW